MAVEDDSSADDSALERLLPDSVTRRLASDGVDDDSILVRYLPEPALNVLQAIRGSFVYFIAALGVLFLFLAVLGHFLPAGVPLLSDLTTGVMAGLWAIWGVSAILYAGIAYLLMIAVGYK